MVNGTERSFGICGAFTNFILWPFGDEAEGRDALGGSLPIPPGRQRARRIYINIFVDLNPSSDIYKVKKNPILKATPAHTLYPNQSRVILFLSFFISINGLSKTFAILKFRLEMHAFKET